MAYSNNRNTNNRNTNTTRAALWTDISGRMVVFGNERESRKGGTYLTYCTTIARKREDGSFHHIYFDVLFHKDQLPEIEGRFDIIVKRGFLTIREFPTENGTQTNPAVMVQEYEFI